MKKFTFGLFTLLFLASCASDSDDPSDTSKDSYKINIQASVQSTNLVKAGPINSGFTTDFPIGIYAYNGAWKSGATANVINNDQATVLGAVGHAVTFASGPYYYPSDGTPLEFFAFAPQGTETIAAGVGTSPVVTHAMTGQEDIMWASSSGHKSGSSAAVHPTLSFQHQLAQLQFTFKSDATYPASGNSVVSLTVNTQPNLATMTVGTGACVFSGSAAMQALSTANQTSGIGITTAGTSANSPIMTAPASSFSITIIVKPAGGGSNVTYTSIPVALTALKGNAHLVTLTFTATSVTASATVADWITGTGGNVSVL